MKKNILLSLLILTFCKNVFSQKSESVQLNMMQNINGTGDTKGITIGVQYTNELKKRLLVGVSIGMTMNSGEFTNIYEYPTGRINNGSLRYTIAGIQIIPQIGYTLIKKAKLNLNLMCGLFLRYQHSSYWENSALLYTTITNIPFPVFVINNRTPQKTFAIGLSPDLQFSYKVSKKIKIGLVTSFQFDTQSDNIINYGLSLTKIIK